MPLDDVAAAHKAAAELCAMALQPWLYSLQEHGLVPAEDDLTVNAIMERFNLADPLTRQSYWNLVEKNKEHYAKRVAKHAST